MQDFYDSVQYALKVWLSFKQTNGISCDVTNCLDRPLTKLVLHGNPKFSFQQNSDIINATIEHIINSKRFLCSLL